MESGRRPSSGGKATGHDRPDCETYKRSSPVASIGRCECALRATQSKLEPLPRSAGPNPPGGNASDTIPDRGQNAGQKTASLWWDLRARLADAERYAASSCPSAEVRLQKTTEAVAGDHFPLPSDTPSL